ncbi:MAG: TonB-dependent receptor plug domain-containing protein [Bacteroidota bacterium]
MRRKGLLIVLFFIIFSCGNALAQKVNFVSRNVALLKVLTEIQKQTGYSIAWNEREVNVERLVDANFINTDLRTVLDQLIAGHPIAYKISGKSIAILPKKLDDYTMANLVTADTVTHLQEVAIINTGYQKIPLQRATGSFVLLDSMQFNRRVGPDVIQRLEGIASGLLFNRNTLKTNTGNLDLSIRGRSTIYANDQPLIVLDNFPFIGDFNSINPNDVEGITILKDAAAAAIWGVRAGNGVIVVTTHHGKKEEPLKVSFNTSLSVISRPNLFYNPKYQSSSEFIDQEISYFNKGSFDNILSDKVNYPAVSQVLTALYKQRQGLQTAEETNRQIVALRAIDIRNEQLKYFYRNGVARQYAMSLTGGTVHSAHSFSMGLDKNNQSLKNNSDSRLTISSQNKFTLLKNLELEAGLNFIRSEHTGDSTLYDMTVFKAAPYDRLKDEYGKNAILAADHTSEYKSSAQERGFLDWNYRPLDDLGKNEYNYRGDNLRLNGVLKYNIFPGLAAAVNYQFQNINNTGNRYNDVASYAVRRLINRYAVVTDGKVTGYNIPVGGILNTYTGKAKIYNTRFQFDYEKRWIKHEVTAIAGYEFSSFNSDFNGQQKYGYDPALKTSIPIKEDITFPLNPSGAGSLSENSIPLGLIDRIRSTYGTASYVYLSRYVISASARVDGSNYFGINTNQKFVPLWSTGAVWKLDHEKFYNVNWLPILQFKASYGFNGNLDKRTTGITTIALREPTTASSGLPYAVISNTGNPDLRWEQIGITNVGINFALKNQIVSGSVEYFVKKGTGILGDKTFATSTGIKTLRGNYAAITGQGLDLMLTTKNLDGLIKWSTTFLFSTISDEVTKYGIVQTNAFNFVGAENLEPILGRPLSGVYSYRSAGLDPLTGEQLGYLNGMRSNDYAGIINTTSPDDLIFHGTARPTKFGSLINNVALGRFTLGINLSFKFDYYFRNATTDYFSVYGGNVLKNTFYDNLPSSVAKGDHIRIQDVSLDYNAQGLLKKRLGLKKLSVYAYASNLGLLWKANKFDLDPDMIPYTQSSLIFPSPFNIAFGIKGNW